jgi:preprotein translocase subunit SecA
MLLWGFPNAAWLAPVLVRWRREFLRLSGGWEQSETSPEKLPAAAAVARGPHVGSNDPCPCGSGRQCKKCHGTAEVGV